jgi:hypothetical protein
MNPFFRLSNFTGQTKSYFDVLEVVQNNHIYKTKLLNHSR